MNTRLASVHRFRQVLNRPELRLTPVLGQPGFLSRSGDSSEYGDDRGVELPARVLAWLIPLRYGRSEVIAS
jgi:hypothetical protein